MALHWPTFFTRLGSAVVFCVVMMTGLLWTEWAFFGLATLIQVLCLKEYFRMMKLIYPEPRQPSWVHLAVQLAGFGLLSLLALGLYEPVILPEGSFSLSYWPALLFVPVLLLMAGTLSKHFSFGGALYALGGLLYIVLPLALLIFLREKSVVLPLALVLMLWTNDTMAYLVGSFIGKTPFSPISPKKTWEGTAGGALLTIAGAAVWGFYAADHTMIDWMVLALCAAVAGTAGDLFESKLKRLAGGKDSGKLMPGHGGALDRFDSLLVATPFAFCYAYLCM